MTCHIVEKYSGIILYYQIKSAKHSLFTHWIRFPLKYTYWNHITWILDCGMSFQSSMDCLHNIWIKLDAVKWMQVKNWLTSHNHLLLTLTMHGWQYPDKLLDRYGPQHAKSSLKILKDPNPCRNWALALTNEMIHWSALPTEFLDMWRIYLKCVIESVDCLRMLAVHGAKNIPPGTFIGRWNPENWILDIP